MSIKIKHCKGVHTARGEVVMLHAIANFIAITKEEGKEEEKKKVVFWQPFGKKSIIFCSICCCLL